MNYLGCFFFGILLLSCKKGINYSKDIINNTEFDLSFYFYNTSLQYNADSVKVKAYQKITYYTTELKENQNSTLYNVCDPQIQPNDFLVKVSDNKTLIKNISVYSNWVCTNENNARKASFTVNPEDIQ